MLDTEQNAIFSSFLAFLSSRMLRRVPEGSRQEKGPPVSCRELLLPQEHRQPCPGLRDSLRNAAPPGAEGMARGSRGAVPSLGRRTRPPHLGDTASDTRAHGTTHRSRKSH